MIKNIDKSHLIFISIAYQNDIVPFYLIELIKHAPMLLASNEKSFIIAMSTPAMPIWVWTTDNIASGDISELCEYLYNNFKDTDPLRFAAKPMIAKALTEQFIELKSASCDVVNMESFVCNSLIPAKNTSGHITRPSAGDTDDIAQCLSGFFIDGFSQVKTKGESIEAAKNFIDKPISFVLQYENKIVSIACSVTETPKYAAINHVYTRPEYRGRGFAAAIVAYICNLIFDSGKIPLLYTDLSNSSSNKAYKNVGFVACGKVDEVILHWSDKDV